MIVWVGSTNPVKIAAVQDGFARYFGAVETTGHGVASTVSEQPVGDETYTGAHQRAASLRTTALGRDLPADYFVGIEGGMVWQAGRWFALGVVCVINRAGAVGFGTSGLFELPRAFSAQMLAGVELGLVIDAYLAESNTKQRGGAVSLLTQGHMDRRTLYLDGVILALIPFVSPALYESQVEGGDIGHTAGITAQ
jgi:inosine/xanthosine triphosphatase